MARGSAIDPEIGDRRGGIRSTSWTVGHPYFPRKVRTPEQTEERKLARRVYLNDWQKDYYRRNIEKEGERNRALHRIRRYSQYGLTKEMFDEYFDAQEGCCGFCGGVMTPDVEGVRSKVAIDHDHDTGRYRGLVHIQCNSIIALAEEHLSEYLATSQEVCFG